MVFSSFEFLFRFLPIFLMIYYVTPKHFRNHVLFAGSILFYAFGQLRYVFLLLASVLINYILGRWMYRGADKRQGRRQQVILVLALCYDFGLLFFYKYSGLTKELPLGISFYTFQIAAYIIDVYRGTVSAETSLVNLGAYLTMFPQLVAGPIINYEEVRGELWKRSICPKDFEEGLKLLVLGLGAKVIIADRIGMLWNSVQMIGFVSISTPLAWMGVAAYTMELYFDFSGYSLMARGLGRMLGFEIPVNFRHPYMSASVSEFWRRWHITLGRWFREYVYIPLGGNRRGKARTCFNMLVVWTFTALWHGADYNYLIWGSMLLVLLAMEKLFLYQWLENRRLLGHLYVLFVVPLTWVPFAIADVGQIGVYFTRLFPFLGAGGEAVNAADYLKYLSDYGLLLFIGVVFASPIPSAFYKSYGKKWLGDIAVSVIMLLSIYYLTISTNNPFMYFNF